MNSFASVLTAYGGWICLLIPSIAFAVFLFRAKTIDLQLGTFRLFISRGTKNNKNQL